MILAMGIRLTDFNWVMRSVLGAILGVVCFVNTAQAQSCEMPPRLSRLSAFLISLPNVNGPIPVRTASDLAAQLDELDDQTLVELLRKHGVQSLAITLADIIAEADRIAASATMTDHRRLKRLLYDLNQQSMIACNDSNGLIYQKIQDERAGGTLFSDGVNWEEIDNVLANNPPLALALLASLIGAVVGLLYLIDSSYRLAMALMYNRKACRISAILCLGTDAVPVTITTLGRGGCRILPNEPVMYDQYLGKIRQSGGVFEIGEFMIQANVSAIYKDVSDFRFPFRITLKTQKGLLAQSTISPFYIKNNSKKPQDGGGEGEAQDEAATERMSKLKYEA